MEQAGPRPRDPRGSTGAASGAGTGFPEARGRAARVPQQPGVADVNRERGIAPGAPRRGGGDAVRGDAVRGDAVRDDAVRGEHTHSEAPIPRPVVQRASVRGQILDALRAALVAGDLTPGEVYSAPALGERFGVSATPVREAMQQLALEGAVEVVPNRGFRVVERGARELAELAEIRALIEMPVVLRLARTLPAERWDELRPLAEETARAAASGCPAAYGEADRAFHRAVLGLAGNEQLVRVADDLHRRSQWPLGGEPVRCRSGMMADAAVHLALLDALVGRDLGAVEGLLREHFSGA